MRFLSSNSLFGQAMTFFLGVLLMAQGAGKFGDWNGYLTALSAFEFLSEARLYDVGTVWALTELCAGGLLIFGVVVEAKQKRIRMMGALSALLIATAYFTMTTQAYLRDLAITNCTCFGSYFPQPLSPFLLTQDVLALLWAAWEIFKAK